MYSRNDEQKHRKSNIEGKLGNKLSRMFTKIQNKKSCSNLITGPGLGKNGKKRQLTRLLSNIPQGHSPSPNFG